MLIKHNIVTLLVFSSMVSATTAGFSTGAGAVYNESSYRGYNDDVHAVPLVSYESESFYFGQTMLGYILSRSESNKFSIATSYMPLEFDPDDNDDHVMKKSDKCDVTAMAGAAWYHHERWGSVKVPAAADTLDNSNGWVGGVSLFRSTPMGRLTSTPSIGVLYYNEKFNEHYYGIPGDESCRSSLSSYSPGDSWTSYVGPPAKYALAVNLTLLASTNYSALSGDIKNSLIVDRDNSSTLMPGLTWRF